MSSGSEIHRRSNSDSNGVNDDGDDEEEHEAEISVADTEKERKKRSVFGRYAVGVRKGKKGLLFRFRKLQRLFESSKSHSPPPPSSSPDSRRRFGGVWCCCACLSKPQVVESDDSGGNVDPDDPEGFSYEYLKSLIEKNDFYSKECDTHFDC